jgi:hypothetical protein
MTESIETTLSPDGALEEPADRPRGFRYQDIIGLWPELDEDFEQQVKERRKDRRPDRTDEIARMFPSVWEELGLMPREQRVPGPDKESK